MKSILNNGTDFRDITGQSGTADHLGIAGAPDNKTGSFKSPHLAYNLPNILIFIILNSKFSKIAVYKGIV